MLAGMGALASRALGASYWRSDLWRSQDRLGLTVRQPLRVVSGSAQIATTSVDEQTGVPSTGYEAVSLAPDGRETDFILSYVTPLKKAGQLGLQAGYIHDYQNRAGVNVPTLGVTWSSRF